MSLFHPDDSFFFLSHNISTTNYMDFKLHPYSLQLRFHNIMDVYHFSTTELVFGYLYRLYHHGSFFMLTGHFLTLSIPTPPCISTSLLLICAILSLSLPLSNYLTSTKHCSRLLLHQHCTINLTTTPTLTFNIWFAPTPLQLHSISNILHTTSLQPSPLTTTPLLPCCSCYFGLGKFDGGLCLTTYLNQIYFSTYTINNTHIPIYPTTTPPGHNPSTILFLCFFCKNHTVPRCNTKAQ